MAESRLARAITGLNNKVDPVRLRYDPEQGVSELSEATNITIDVTGRAQRRLGWNLVTAGEFHSIWCDGGDAFAIQETPSWGSIMLVAPDLSVSGVLSGLSKNKRMSFVDFFGVTYTAVSHIAKKVKGQLKTDRAYRQKYDFVNSQIKM